VVHAPPRQAIIRLLALVEEAPFARLAGRQNLDGEVLGTGFDLNGTSVFFDLLNTSNFV